MKPPMKRALWPDSVSRPVATPLQPSVVYAADDPDSLDDQYEGRTHGYTYAREGHPNAGVLAGLIDGMVNFDADHDALYVAPGVTLVRDQANGASSA